MPELRRDPVLGRWVIIAAERAKRPTDFKLEPQPKEGKFCPFCEGNEHSTPPEILAIRNNGARPNTSGWKIRVVPNKFPALRVEGNLEKRGEGIYDLMNGIGAHEVIIESPRHVISLTELEQDHVRDVLWVYRERLLDLKKDKRLIYGLIFKNVGSPAGASLQHSHSQLIVTPTVPKTVAEEMSRTDEFYRFRGRCLFCDMIRQEISSYVRIVMERENFVAFAPFAARFPFETWILPKKHASHFESIQPSEMNELAAVLRGTLQKLEKALNFPPYNYIIHTSPFSESELEGYHWHIEIIPRLTKIAGFEWGTDFYINPVPPEHSAQYLREIQVE
jgi:UDPglucose--hexose-1-phosphate uridylyltransferase